jgi:hypothetical protein
MEQYNVMGLCKFMVSIVFWTSPMLEKPAVTVASIREA